MTWTYGCEHEWGDWDRRIPLPAGFGVDEKDVTVMNSNGIAADPKGLLYPFGGEINTPPTTTLVGQVAHLHLLKILFPEAAVNHRSNLHVHVRVPEMIENLGLLKKVAVFNRTWLPQVLPIIEPIPLPEGTGEELRGAKRRYRRRLVSHHTVVTEERLQKQLSAKTVEEFYAAECPEKDGQPLWHLAPRHAVNLRHMREETQTIEFRHFPGTLIEDELLCAIEWCRLWLRMALGLCSHAPLEMARRYAPYLPKFPLYVHWREVNYRHTCHDGTLSKEAIKDNIRRILGKQ